MIIIVEFVASFIEIYIIYDIFQLLLSNIKSFRKTKAICLAMIGALLIVQGLNAISLFSSATIIVMVLYWSTTAKYIFKSEYAMALSITAFYVIAAVAYDFFFFTAASVFWGGKEAFMALIEKTSQSRMIVVLADKTVWAVIYFFTRRFLSKAYLDKDSRDFFMKISVAGFIACLVLAKLTFDGLPEAINHLWCILFCALAFMVFYHSFAMNIKMHDAQLEMIALGNQLLEQNYKNVNDILANNAELYHDLNNHLDTLYQLADSNNIPEVKEYIERIAEPIKILNKVIWTGNELVDAILNSKLKKSEQLNVKISFNVEYPANSCIHPNDICAILSNLVDNAIEAATKCDKDKDIRVTIRKINKFIIIKVVNTLFEPVKTLAGKIVTTKKNSFLHGWGMLSIKAAVEKYGGSVKYAFDDRQFTATVILFL